MAFNDPPRPISDCKKQCNETALMQRKNLSDVYKDAASNIRKKLFLNPRNPYLQGQLIALIIGFSKDSARITQNKMNCIKKLSPLSPNPGPRRRRGRSRCSYLL